MLVTSATLKAGDSFSHSLGPLGLQGADQLDVPSPFDYRRQALVILVEDMPEPGMPGYHVAIEDVLHDAAIAADGRTLGLFTSHAAVRQAQAELKPRLAEAEIPVLAQRLDGSPGRLLRMLMDQPRTLLLGTAAFWEGVDVPGDALSQIAIARLPFPVPSDPIYAGRAEQFEDPFGGVRVARCVAALQAGLRPPDPRTAGSRGAARPRRAHPPSSLRRALHRRAAGARGADAALSRRARGGCGVAAAVSGRPGRASGTWTRGLGVSLVHANFAALAADDGIRRGLLDGIERGLDDRVVDPPEGAQTFAIRAAGVTVGMLAAAADAPGPGGVTVLALAIAPDHRGHAFGSRALLAAERRWLRDGASRVHVRVPATNGRGLYWMLRCGFTPLLQQPEIGATWFARRVVEAG